MSASMDEVYSAREVARAAGVSAARVAQAVKDSRVNTFGAFLGERDATRLVRLLSGRSVRADRLRPPLTILPEPKRRSGLSLVASGLLHGGFVAAILLIGYLGLLSANDTEQVIKDDSLVHLVYLMEAGPGGGGGGSGVHIPAPPPPAERKAPVPKKISSPVPPVRKPPPPPPVVTPPPPRIDPPKPPPQIVQAPIVPVPADPIEKVGVLEQTPSTAPTAGPGAGGSAGSGAGTGLGDGQGSGIGPGSGGGIGGGPFQPGNGIEPPTLLREVKPLYTEEARRRSVEGNVMLEIVVRRDGSVGDVHVTRSLGAGLEQRAIDAVRQWRFGPARRQGVAVDVIVEVSVGFRLR